MSDGLAALAASVPDAADLIEEFARALAARGLAIRAGGRLPRVVLPADQTMVQTMIVELDFTAEAFAATLSARQVDTGTGRPRQTETAAVTTGARVQLLLDQVDEALLTRLSGQVAVVMELDNGRMHLLDATDRRIRHW